MYSCEDMFPTVEPSELFSLGQLMLRWPYNTVQNISTEACDFIREGIGHFSLDLYVLKNLYYQNEPTEFHNYVGFVLHLQPAPTHNYEYQECVANFSNTFVLKQQVKEIESRARHYTMRSPGHEKTLKGTICTKKNIKSFASQVLHKIFQNLHGEGAQPMLSVETVWPWLGPIEPPLLQNPDRSTVTDDREMKFFVATAIQLGQTEKKCLARMLSYRYPELSYAQLHDIVEPESDRLPANKPQQARRWAGKA